MSLFGKIPEPTGPWDSQAMRLEELDGEQFVRVQDVVTYFMNASDAPACDVRVSLKPLCELLAEHFSSLLEGADAE